MSVFFDKVAARLDKLDAEGRRRQFRALANEINFFESVFRAMKEGVIVSDAEGRLVYANEAAEKLADFRFAKVKDRPLAEILPDWDWPGLLSRHEEGDGWRRTATREIEIAYPERRVLEVEARPHGNGSVTLVHDVTAARARTASEMESGRTDAVRDLAAQVAHEIGNPLNALSLDLQLLARKYKDEPDIGIALGEVKRISEIIRGFLDALRPAKPNLVPGSLADPLKDALAAMKTQFEDKKVRVSLDLPPAVPAVLLDRAQMEQVFFNLVKNALEAMCDGGELDIEISVDDRAVSASFRDSGAGMADETITHLFEAYRTTKEHGTGLGLLVCRRIVRDHGGELVVESKEGEGSRMTVRLPRIEKRVRRLT